MNMAMGRVRRADDRLFVEFGDTSLAIADELVAERPGIRAYEGREVVLGIRPEDIEEAALSAAAPAERTIATVCTLREALGSEVLVHFPAVASAADSDTVEPLGDASAIFVARLDAESTAREGERLSLVVDTRRLHFFDPATGDAVRGDGEALLHGGARVGAAVGG